jgi:hypothetical protein
MLIAPHVIHRMLPPCPDSPALGEIKEHTLRTTLRIQDHKYNAIAAIAGPVLRRRVRVRDIIGVDAPAKRRDALPPIWVLVNLDEIFVLQNIDVGLQVRITRLRQIGPNNQR